MEAAGDVAGRTLACFDFRLRNSAASTGSFVAFLRSLLFTAFWSWVLHYRRTRHCVGKLGLRIRFN